METGPDALSLKDALVKAKQILKETFPEQPSVDDVCKILHQHACIIHTAGQTEKLIEPMSKGPHGEATGKEGTASAQSAVEIVNDNVELRQNVASCMEKLFEWLELHFPATDVERVDERMDFIYDNGMRQGDEKLWMDCFKGSSKASADSNAESASASTSPQSALDIETGFLRIGETNIPMISFAGSSCPDPTCTECTMEAAIWNTMMDGVSTVRSGDSAQTYPPAPSEAGPSAASQDAPIICPVQ